MTKKEVREQIIQLVKNFEASGREITLGPTRKARQYLLPWKFKNFQDNSEPATAVGTDEVNGTLSLNGNLDTSLR